MLLGLRVASAFRVPRAKLLLLDEAALPCPVLVLPHTSGVSHFWNRAANVQAAERAFRDAMCAHMSTRSRFFREAAASRNETACA